MIYRRLLLIILTMLFFISGPLWAQDSGHYVIEQRYVQQLVWVGDEYTLKYEVVIERAEEKTYRAYSREFTEKPALQVSLPPGNYRYRIISYDYLEQPGGVSDWVNLEIKPAAVLPVEAQTEGRSPDGSKTFSLYLSAAWSPLIPLYGGIQKVFGNEFYAAGASLRLGAFYDIPDWWVIPGLEFSASWYALDRNKGGDTVETQAGAAGVNITAQKRFFNQKMAVTLRAGGALAFQIGETSTEDEAKTIGGLTPQLNIEVSYLYQVWKQLYAEAGLTFTFYMIQNDSSGCLRPWLGVGWQF